ncbi:UNVERIFIED_CONTAM: hypothetical protein Sradi_2499600 [Sesamum radiatum]|uniref:Uncharacterized protein n=1 Tax=Sesamum radiatum TaxID=300843 RepID=A0AAW2SK24_SESRA
MGQLVSIVSQRKDGQLLSDKEKNPREQVNAFTIKSGNTTGDEIPKEQVEETQPLKVEKPQEKMKGSLLKLNLDIVSPYILYAKRILKANLDKQVAKILEILKNIHVSIPLIDALKQMLSYAMFLKEVISNKLWQFYKTNFHKNIRIHGVFLSLAL